MRVLVTGSTGFIGSHLTRFLSLENHEVYAIIRPNSNTLRIDDVVGLLNVVRSDLKDAENMKAHLRRIKPELCYHLAWYAEPGKYLTSDENAKMLLASKSLASNLADAGCKRLIAAGTCLEYESQERPLPENSPTKPLSPYAAGKLSLYDYLKEVAQVSEMDFAWTRLFYQYGPCEDQRRFVPSVICALLSGKEVKTTSGEQIRDFLHVEDVASAILAVGKTKLHGAVNVGSGIPISVKEVGLRIGKLLGHPELITINPTDKDKAPNYLCADNSLLKHRTDWKPLYDLDHGLLHTIAWWRQRMNSPSSGK